MKDWDPERQGLSRSSLRGSNDVSPIPDRCRETGLLDGGRLVEAQSLQTFEHERVQVELRPVGGLCGLLFGGLWLLLLLFVVFFVLLLVEVFVGRYGHGSVALSLLLQLAPLPKLLVLRLLLESRLGFLREGCRGDRGGG